MNTPKPGHIARRAALGGVIGLGAAVTIVAIDPGAAGITPQRALDAFARLTGWSKPHSQIATTTDSAIPPGAPIGGPFRLTDQYGKTITQRHFRGRWMLIYFGYTRCPDECPLTLEKMAVLLTALGSAAAKLAPIFITIDPTHDTPAVLARYLEKFSPGITGLTGPIGEIAKVAALYDAYFNAANHEASGKSKIGHSTFLYLMTPNNRFANLFPVTITVPQLITVLRPIIDRHG